MKELAKYGAVFLTGAFGYGGIELLYRGWTHWSMLCAGGVCLLLIYLINRKINAAFWQKCILGGAVITTVEFVTGGIVNILLGWNVWDYSGRMFDLMGQICPALSLCWVLLSAPALLLCRLADGVFGTGAKPERNG